MFSKVKNKNTETDSKVEFVEIPDTGENAQRAAASKAPTKVPGHHKKPAQRATSMPSLISSDVIIKGSLLAQNDMQFDGVLEGDIQTSQELVIGEGAVVKGELVSDRTRISGTVEGSLRANKVELLASAHVKGDILHKALSVETGARFDGNCRFSDDPTAEPSKPRSTGMPPPSTTTTAASPASAAPGQEAPSDVVVSPDPTSNVETAAQPVPPTPQTTLTTQQTGTVENDTVPAEDNAPRMQQATAEEVTQPAPTGQQLPKGAFKKRQSEAKLR